MTDNEIIKALECCTQGRDIKVCWHCPLYVDLETARECCEKLNANTLDLINRQKAELEKFKKRQKPTGASGYKIENGKVVFFTNMLGGCKIVKENLEEVVKTLNELLHEAYAKDEIAFALKCKSEELENAKAEAVKEFADRLQNRCIAQDGCLYASDIGDELNELVGDDK